MDEKKIFKGIVLVKQADFSVESADMQTLYFVRTNEDKKDGYFWFNGKIYGSGSDVLDTIHTELGTLPEGYNTWKDYIEAVSNFTDLEERVETLESGLTAETSAREEAINAVNSAITAETSAREEAINEVNSAITAETSAREEAINEVNSAITAETSAREEADNTLSGRIDDVEERVETLEAISADTRLEALEAISAKTESAVQSVNGKTGTAVTINADDVKMTTGDDAVTVKDAIDTLNADENTEGSVDYKIKEAIEEVNGVKVTDVAYNSDTNYIQLTLADGSKTTGFDASAFIVDGMLDTVQLVDKNDKNEEGQFIKLSWNTDADKTDIYLNVTDLVDVYTGDNATISVNSANTISVIMDQANGAASHNALTAETSAREEAINTVNSAITAETSAREEAINEVNSAITAETSAREEAINEVNSAITDEASARTEADEALSERIEALEALSADTESAIQGVVVNGVTATTEDNIASVTVDADKVNIATAITAQTGETADAVKTIAETGVSTNQAIQNVVDEIVANEKTTAEALNDLDERVTSAQTTADAAKAKADTAVQSVNSKTGTAITLNATEIEVGSDVDGTGTMTTTSKISDVLSDIYAKLGVATKVASSANTISITDGENGLKNLEVNREEATETTVANGHIAIDKNDSGALYATMYFSGNDVEE